jgi:phage shock protein PspC (stress-responsive transcriptional regulator)
VTQQTAESSQETMMDEKPPRRLRKSNDKIIAGVCGGIAEWLGWDPTLVRVGYVVISIVSIAFPGIFVYLLLWLIMPQPEGAAPT